MPPEAEVAEPEVVEKAKVIPAGKTPMGEKFRETFNKMQAEITKRESPPEKEAEKSTTVDSPPAAAKLVSPLDVATGEKKPAAEPVQDDKAWEQSEAVKEFDPKTANWLKAREKIGRQDIELQTLRKQVETSKTAVADAKTVEELQAARAELEAARKKISDQELKMKSINAEYSDEYQGLIGKYDKAVGKVVRRFETIVGKGTGDALADAIQMRQGKIRNDAIKSILADERLDNDDRMELRSLLSSVDSTTEEIEDFRKDMPARFDEISKKREEATRAASEQSLKELESNFGKVISELPNDNVFLRTIDGTIPGAAEWNGAIKKAQDTALAHLKPGQSFDSSAALLVKGADYDRVVKYAMDMRKQLSEAQSRLSEYDKSGPDFKGTSKKTPEVPLTGYEKYLREKERLEAARRGGTD